MIDIADVVEGDPAFTKRLWVEDIIFALSSPSLESRAHPVYAGYNAWVAAIIGTAWRETALLRPAGKKRAVLR